MNAYSRRADRQITPTTDSPTFAPLGSWRKNLLVATRRSLQTGTELFRDALTVQPTAATDRPDRQKLSTTKNTGPSRQRHGGAQDEQAPLAMAPGSTAGPANGRPPSPARQAPSQRPPGRAEVRETLKKHRTRGPPLPLRQTPRTPRTAGPVATDGNRGQPKRRPGCPPDTHC